MGAHLVFDQRLGLNPASDRASDRRDLLSEVRVAARASGDMRRTRSFAGFFWNWLLARDGLQAPSADLRVVKISGKEFGDINLSTLLSVLMVFGLVLASQL